MTTSTYRATDEAFRLQLDESAVWHRMVSAGDRVPDIPLVEVDLGPIHLRRMRDIGSLVLVFFRYAGSPLCADALRAYQDSLRPALTDLDAHLVAVSRRFRPGSRPSSAAASCPTSSRRTPGTR